MHNIYSQNIRTTSKINNDKNNDELDGIFNETIKIIRILKTISKKILTGMKFNRRPKAQKTESNELVKCDTGN